jgi:hypothetical protein
LDKIGGKNARDRRLEINHYAERFE